LEPVVKFTGLNKVVMFGDSCRLFFGIQPRNLIVTFLLINVPATYFNSTVVVVSKLKPLI